ncbi:MAG: hypothetical protein ABI859_17715 [Pseudomonadota bacterium]
MRGLFSLLLLTLSTQALAAEPLRFISCPIYRDADAGRKSGCWLVDDATSGVRYDVSPSPTKPDWNHEALVEGVVAAKQVNACGGVVLDPVRVSILEGACTRHMLPAEGFPGRVFVLPPRNIQPLSVARVPPPPPWTRRTFSLLFEFNRSFGVYQLDDFLLDEAITYIRAVNPQQVIVTGRAATTPANVSGRILAERDDVARERAQMVGESLRRLGVPAAKLVVKWEGAALPSDAAGADGLLEPSRRRADIDVIP